MPTDAGLRRVIAFQDRPGIDITLLLPAERAKKLVDFIQFVLDQIVIIIAPGIARDLSCSPDLSGCAPKRSTAVTDTPPQSYT